MKISKNSLLVVLLIAIAGNVHGMDQKPSWKKRAQWVTTVGEVALGLKPVSALMTQKSTKPAESKPSDFNTPLPILEPKEFTDLPKDVQNQIMGILLAGQNANSFKEAAQTINSLAQVNKELNALINDQQYTLDLVKHLAKKFNATLDDVVIALGGRNAFKQSRFNLTKEIRSLNLKIRLSPQEELSAYLKQPEISKNFDPNYLDDSSLHAELPLHSAILAENSNEPNYREKKVRMLLNIGADPSLKGTGNYAKTPLEFTEEMAAWHPEDEGYPKIIKLLKEYTK